MRVYTVILIAGIVSGILLQGSFLHGMLLAAGAVFVAAPVGLFLAMWCLYSVSKHGEISGRCEDSLRLCAVCFLSALLSAGVGFSIQGWKVREARSFVSATVSHLDRHYAKHGSYPVSLAQIGLDRLPWLLAWEGGYRSFGDRFRFEYIDESGMLDSWVYDSEERVWVHWD